MNRNVALAIVASLAAWSGPAEAADGPPPAPRPLLRDFIGLNVHTVQFKPELYRPVARLVRDYHGFQWDVGDDSAGCDLGSIWRPNGTTTS